MDFLVQGSEERFRGIAPSRSKTAIRLTKGDAAIGSALTSFVDQFVSSSGDLVGCLDLLPSRYAVPSPHDAFCPQGVRHISRR